MPGEVLPDYNLCFIDIHNYMGQNSSEELTVAQLVMKFAPECTTYREPQANS
jgi:hypothetical protein